MSNNQGDLLTANGAVLGHPSGLFVLFFTEMWERFSYYGMRALLIMFFTAALMDGGWGWPQENAFAIFGTYVSMVYLSTMVGGYIADNIIGYRNSVALGALLMSLGHGSMALETPFFVYAGLTLLVVGSGFFKPCMTSIISEMYEKYPERKDGAYTIFYMGVNSGAFLGILLCGYLGERIGWTYGFGLAGIFMLFGLLQFWFAQGVFGDAGLKPNKEKKEVLLENDNDKRNPFETWQIILSGIAAFMGFVWAINDPVSKISAGSVDFLGFNLGGYNGPTVLILLGFVFSLILPLFKVSSFSKTKRNQLILTYKIAFILLILVLGITWVATYILGINFTDLSGSIITIISAVYIFLVVTVFRLTQYFNITRDKMIAVLFFCFVTIFFWAVFEQAPGSLTIFARDYTDRVLEGSAGMTFNIVNSILTLVPLSIFTWIIFLLYKQIGNKYGLSFVFLVISFLIIWGITLWMLQREFAAEKAEITASWFGILNSLYIIIFAPLFSKWWESKYNPSANMKYAIGMFLLGLGMACVAFGANGIAPGAKTASVSIIWLVLVYLFHTLGELCISPVSLSLVSKLVPGRMIAFMYGMYYLAIAIGMKLAGVFGGASEGIAEESGISYFFWILTAVSVALGVLCILLSPIVKRLMHGVR